MRSPGARHRPSKNAGPQSSPALRSAPAPLLAVAACVTVYERVRVRETRRVREWRVLEEGRNGRHASARSRVARFHTTHRRRARRSGGESGDAPHRERVKRGRGAGQKKRKQGWPVQSAVERRVLVLGDGPFSSKKVFRPPPLPFIFCLFLFSLSHTKKGSISQSWHHTKGSATGRDTIVRRGGRHVGRAARVALVSFLSSPPTPARLPPQTKRFKKKPASHMSAHRFLSVFLFFKATALSRSTASES